MYECRKAKNSREDDVDDVDKLMSFFAEMKATNDEFYFEYKLMRVTE